MLDATACELVKDPGAIHTADPRLIAEARPIAQARPAFVTALAEAGARIIHPVAAARAQRCGLELRFTSVRPDGAPATVVTGTAADARSLVLAEGHGGLLAQPGDPAEVATITLVCDGPGIAAAGAAAAAAVRRLGAPLLRVGARSTAVSFLVPAAQGIPLLRALHGALHRTARPGQSRGRLYAHR